MARASNQENIDQVSGAFRVPEDENIKNEKITKRQQIFKETTLPIYEPRLKEYLQRAASNGNLKFISLAQQGFQEEFEKAEAIFVCVNTPPVIQKSQYDAYMGQ